MEVEGQTSTTTTLPPADSWAKKMKGYQELQEAYESALKAYGPDHDISLGLKDRLEKVSPQ
eukprot:10591498-Karenia_brevis.AAC.1